MKEGRNSTFVRFVALWEKKNEGMNVMISRLDDLIIPSTCGDFQEYLSFTPL